VLILQYSIYNCLFSADMPSIIAPPENTTTVTIEGETITIACEAVGYPPPTIVWNRTNGSLSDRVLLMNDIAGVSFGNTTVKINLTLTNVYREDSGLYQCTAYNFIDNDLRTISITVQCKC